MDNSEKQHEDDSEKQDEDDSKKQHTCKKENCGFPKLTPSSVEIDCLSKLTISGNAKENNDDVNEALLSNNDNGTSKSSSGSIDNTCKAVRTNNNDGSQNKPNYDKHNCGFPKLTPSSVEIDCLSKLTMSGNAKENNDDVNEAPLSNNDNGTSKSTSGSIDNTCKAVRTNNNDGSQNKPNYDKHVRKYNEHSSIGSIVNEFRGAPLYDDRQTIEMFANASRIARMYNKYGSTTSLASANQDDTENLDSELFDTFGTQSEVDFRNDDNNDELIGAFNTAPRAVHEHVEYNSNFSMAENGAGGTNYDFPSTSSAVKDFDAYKHNRYTGELANAPRADPKNRVGGYTETKANRRKEYKKSVKYWNEYFSSLGRYNTTAGTADFQKKRVHSIAPPASAVPMFRTANEAGITGTSASAPSVPQPPQATTEANIENIPTVAPPRHFPFGLEHFASAAPVPGFMTVFPWQQPLPMMLPMIPPVPYNQFAWMLPPPQPLQTPNVSWVNQVEEKLIIKSKEPNSSGPSAKLARSTSIGPQVQANAEYKTGVGKTRISCSCPCPIHDYVESTSSSDDYLDF